VRRLALICLLVAVSGCGGDDKKDAEQTVRDFVDALNTHDADRYCDELITKEFLEKTTFNTGDEATALVRRRTTGAGASDQLFKLKKEDGDFRVASSGGD